MSQQKAEILEITGVYAEDLKAAQQREIVQGRIKKDELYVLIGEYNDRQIQNGASIQPPRQKLTFPAISSTYQALVNAGIAEPMSAQDVRDYCRFQIQAERDANRQ